MIRLRLAQIVVFLAVAILSHEAISQLWTTTYSQGRRPSDYFSVVAVLQDSTSKSVTYKLVSWYDLEKFSRTNPQATFSLPVPEGKFSQDRGEINDALQIGDRAHFKVVGESGGCQIIELDWDINDDYSSVSTYSTDGTSIKLISSYQRTPGPVILGFFTALLVSSLTGKLLRSRLQRS